MPSGEARERALHILEEEYEKARWVLKEDFDTKEAFYRAVQRIDRSSSPGYPYMRESPTNGEWLGFDGAWYDEYKLEVLWFDCQKVLRGEWELILRAFVKAEPHKKSKAEANRWRLILASPLCVQVVWHMMFDYGNDKEIEKAYWIPSQQGMVLVNGGWKQFYKLWTGLGYDCGLDKSAWDWTVPGWMFEDDLELRHRLGRGNRMGEWRTICDRLYNEMFVRPLVVLSNGTLWRQLYPGVMKSGCVNTISTNSHCQAILHLHACFVQGVQWWPLPACCGDDTLQRLSQASDITAYSRYGPVVKSASEGLEFMGHEFLVTGPVPLYSGKHVCNLFYQDSGNIGQYLESMARMYAHSPNQWFWYWVAAVLGLETALCSPEYYRYWYDNMDC